jgi:homoserine O-acetyltransferase/O-succinyltransferase
MLSALLTALLQSTSPPALTPAPLPPPPAQSWPTREADYTVRNFHFRSGETLPEIRLHYTMLGEPHRNAAGEIDNAVMVLHGTGGSGHQFLVPQFASQLYGPGQPLDIRKYWIILPDNIGHGGSSKPSDGLRMKFPRYDHDDMVELQHRLLTEGLGLKHIRLIMGTSMGCMHSFVWGETYPDFAKALMPLACEPVQIAGLNRMWRQLVIDGIESDPAWTNGEYTAEPMQGIRTASSISVIVGGAPLNFQALWPDRDSAVKEVRARVARDMSGRDANDMIYQFDSSRNYNPWPDLEKITAPLTWINSADDFINPRNFPYPQEALQRMPNARFRLVPETPDTHGHGTHTWAVNWKADLVALLARSQ